MSRKGVVVLLGMCVGLFLASGLAEGAAATKIKVVVENAAIRLNPSLDSEAIEENVAVDTVFTSDNKVGEWSEVKFKTQLSVEVVGYIHEMYVEVVSEGASQPAPQPAAYRDEPTGMATRGGGGMGLAIRPNLRIGGMFASLQPGYDWEYSFLYYGEDFVIRDSVANGSGFGFDAEFGLFVIPYVEITAGFGMASKGLTGTYGLDVPNAYLWNDIATDTVTQTVNYKANFLSFGLNFYPMPDGRISPFLGLGGCSVSATMDLMEDITYTDTYTFPSYRHSIRINEVMISNEKLSKFGFYFRGGVKFLISPMFYVFAQGKFIMAKVEVEHLLAQYFSDANPLSINLGGFFGGIGLGISF